MSRPFHVETDALRTAATAIAGAGDTFGGSKSLAAARPDAGRSSDEIGDAAKAIGELVDAVAATAGDIAANLQATADDYDAADEQANSRLTPTGPQ